jgi:hypothetical protein
MRSSFLGSSLSMEQELRHVSALHADGSTPAREVKEPGEQLSAVQVEAERQLLTAMLDSARDAIWSWDETGTIMRWNAERSGCLDIAPPTSWGDLFCLLSRRQSTLVPSRSLEKSAMASPMAPTKRFVCARTGSQFPSN